MSARLSSGPGGEPPDADPWEDDRHRMVDRQIARRGVRDERVLAAMRTVPRDRFVPEHRRDEAYRDRPLPIGSGQTISQPYIVAVMIEALAAGPDDRVLEVGAGSGYAAAVLGRVAGEVWAMERHDALARTARARLEALGYGNVHVVTGDGTLGLPEHAPYDAILVSAGGPDVPRPLLDQLATGGRLVIPVDDGHGGQELVRLVRTSDGMERSSLGKVQFVPLVGAEGWEGDPPEDGP